jgi:hypothetical protein
LLADIQHIEAAVAKELDDLRVDVFVRKQFEFRQLHGRISADTKTSFLTAAAA